MFELKLQKFTVPINMSENITQSFEKPIICYLTNKNDNRRFFITFVIIDFKNNEMTFIFSYNEENIKIVNAQPDNKIYNIVRSAHCSICINKDEDFLTFMEEEEFFFYVNYKSMIMKVYTMKDLVKDSNITLKRISSTYYKDEEDPNYFYLAAVDTQYILHIFRVSLDLKNVCEIDSFFSHPAPPHVLRKYKNYLFLSHEFKLSKYEFIKTGEIISQDKLINVIYLYLSRIFNKNNTELNTKDILKFILEEYPVKCLPGKILMIDSKTKQKTYYSTSGGSPAHFEVDDQFIYTSSHNFFFFVQGLIFLEPAIIDKFKIDNGELELFGSFSVPEGYRYTTHKIFHYNDKTYICTFGQPNRLMFIDAEDMKLLFYEDIGVDILGNNPDITSYMIPNYGGTDMVAIEVSEDGRYIIFIGPGYIYFYDFEKRAIYEKIDWNSINLQKDYLQLSDYYSTTVHFNYLD